jgi:hypothetical protein
MHRMPRYGAGSMSDVSGAASVILIVSPRRIMPFFNLKVSVLIGFAVLGGFLALALMVTSACVINTLPRSMEGEAVLAPWPTCLVASLVASVAMPWLASLPLLRDRSRRLYFLACLVAANAVCYLLIGFRMLTEAYLRGL